jgi:maltose O-acetyltransferase
MAAGTWYNCVDAELEALRHAARIAVHEHNTLPPDTRRSVGPALAALLGTVGKDVFIEAPFHCAYGFNIWLGDGVYLNAGCVVIDTASVVIGASTMLGPGVHIYCAEHHPDPAERKAGLEIAKPVRVGARVWIGGRATVLGGVTIGNDAIVGAGAVVTRNVAPGATVVGNPARPIRRAGGSSPTDGAEG